MCVNICNSQSTTPQEHGFLFWRRRKEEFPSQESELSWQFEAGDMGFVNTTVQKLFDDYGWL